MLQSLECHNRTDSEGNPAGGSVDGVGIHIEWQDGPLGRGDDRQEPNGAFVETVIDAAKQRLEHYQESRFACGENAQALDHLAAALKVLEQRTKNREARGVEGTHQA